MDASEMQLLREGTPDGVAAALGVLAVERTHAVEAALWIVGADGRLRRAGDQGASATRAELGLEVLPTAGGAERAPGVWRGRRSFVALPLHAGDALVGVLLLAFVPGSVHDALRDRVVLDKTLHERCALGALALERINLRAAVAHAQHEAVSRVGAGLAHTLGNVLQAALSAVEHARVAPPSDARGSLTEASSALRRASAVMTQLAALGGTRGDPQPTDVTALVSGLVAALEPYMPAGIKLGVERAAGGEVWSDIDALAVEGAIAGLIHTAREQVGTRGMILVAVRAVTAPGGARMCEIEVRSTPMEAALGERATLPLAATTAALPANDGGDTMGAGQLGLDMARAAVARYRGTVEARGEGPTRVTAIRLPVVAARTSPSATSSVSSAAIQTAQAEAQVMRAAGGLTVLVADDEPAVLRGVRRVLTAGGCAVRPARDGAEALSLARAEPTIDVALVDLTMPNLAGPPLVAALRAALPRAPVLVMTGYASDEMIAALRAAGAAMVLKKPIASTRLTEALAQAVASARAPTPPPA